MVKKKDNTVRNLLIIGGIGAGALFLLTRGGEDVPGGGFGGEGGGQTLIERTIEGVSSVPAQIVGVGGETIVRTTEKLLETVIEGSAEGVERVATTVAESAGTGAGTLTKGAVEVPGEFAGGVIGEGQKFGAELAMQSTEVGQAVRMAREVSQEQGGVNIIQSSLGGIAFGTLGLLELFGLTTPGAGTRLSQAFFPTPEQAVAQRAGGLFGFLTGGVGAPVITSKPDLRGGPVRELFTPSPQVSPSKGGGATPVSFSGSASVKASSEKGFNISTPTGPGFAPPPPIPGGGIPGVNVSVPR